MWVRAMDVYGRVYRVVEPKRQRLKQAEEVLHEKQAQLAAAQAKLDEVNAEMRRLQQEYNEKVDHCIYFVKFISIYDSTYYFK